MDRPDSDRLCPADRETGSVLDITTLEQNCHRRGQSHVMREADD